MYNILKDYMNFACFGTDKMYKIFLWNGSTFVISRIYWIMQIHTLQIGLICSHGIVSNGRKEHSKPYIDISNAHFMVHFKEDTCR